MKFINKYFSGSKSIPIDKFIANALYDKNYGYYSKKIPFGKDGDFITAPEISFLFSEMIALWVISFWEHLDKPKVFNIIWNGNGIGEEGLVDGKVIIKVDKNYFRPTEVETLLGDASNAKQKLGWEPKISFKELVSEMVKEDLKNAKSDQLMEKNGYKSKSKFE